MKEADKIVILVGMILVAFQISLIGNIYYRYELEDLQRSCTTVNNELSR